jgi:uncharacterized protein
MFIIVFQNLGLLLRSSERHFRESHLTYSGIIKTKCKTPPCSNARKVGDIRTMKTTMLKNRWLVVVFWVILVSFVAIVTLSGYVLYNLLHPDKKPIQATPAQIQLSYQKIQFRSNKENVLLQGWLIPANSKKKQIVIISHGYGENRSHTKAALPVAKALHDQGIATLLFDFRYSGESGGSKTTIGVYEKNDLLAAIAFAKSKGYSQVGLMGFSMGGVVSIDAAADSPDVTAVIADSPFSDLKPYLQKNLPVWSHLPPFFTPFILALSHWSGVDIDAVRPIQSIQKLREIPVLLIHTKKDPSIPSAESVVLAKMHRGETILWLTSGNVHVGSYEANTKQYLSRVANFFKKSMGLASQMQLLAR